MKSAVLVTLFLFAALSLWSQTTSIPDENFEQALINQEIDLDGVINGQVATADIANVTTLFLDNLFIEDLTGVEDFSALEILDCSGNALPNLDVSQNTHLKHLTCGNGDGGFYGSELQSIDLSQNPELISFQAMDSFELSEVNLKNGNNAILTDVNVRCFVEDSPPCERPICLQVDDAEAANNYEAPYNAWDIYETVTTFTEDCALGTTKYSNLKLSLYPNPVQDILNIEATASLKNISIFNMQGKKVKTISKGFKKINMADFPSGIYFLRIHSEKASVMKKVVKF